jgi:hypothetical protein
MRVGKMGWVEIVVRRPAGSQRWIMQIQNMIHQVPAPVNLMKADEYVSRSPRLYGRTLSTHSLLFSSWT